jgi:hypothetical protein
MWPLAGAVDRPVFLLSHVVMVGTVVPDAVLAVIATAALLLTRPRSHAGLPNPSRSLT